MTARRRVCIPVCITHCIDCGLGTTVAHEWYMVRDEIWEQVWTDRRKSWQRKVPGQEILCIGCLEKRLGRTLTASDFTAVPVNELDGDWPKSPRLRDRLTAQPPPDDGLDIPGFLRRAAP